MEFCYLKRFFAPIQHGNIKMEKIPPEKTGTRIKFVNEIYKQGFIGKANWMHKIDSVYGSTGSGWDGESYWIEIEEKFGGFGSFWREVWVRQLSCLEVLIVLSSSQKSLVLT
jgi:hypothetical protein